MYEKRITFFIDIIGFRNIIEKTETDHELENGIFSLLQSMNRDNIMKELFAEINVSNETEQEIIKLKEFQSLISSRLINDSSIQITHFSDSIVMSVGLENDMYAMSLIEYVGRIIYRLWKDFRILVRGGVSVDDLIHVENGPLFGPAMIKAYDYETHLAIYPRIVFDDTVFNIVGNSQSFRAMKDLFIDYSGNNEVTGREIAIKRGLEINLATSFRHYMNSHFTWNPIKRLEVQVEINNSIKHLETIMAEISEENIKEKYRYLINQITNLNIKNDLTTY